MDPVKRKSHDINYVGQRKEGGETVLPGVGDLSCERREWPDGDTAIVSHWQPTPEELQVLKGGGVVELFLFRAEPIPPISVGVVEHGPEDEADA